MEKKKSSDPTVATATKEASTKTKVNAIEHSAIPKQKDTDQQKKHSRSSKDWWACNWESDERARWFNQC